MTGRGKGSNTLRALTRSGLPADGPFLIVVAGPNGAGKTTFVDHYIRPSGLRIVNPDEVARGIAPLAPASVAYEAADIADALRERLIAAGTSFCMETVFSDPVGAKIASLQRAQHAGYALFVVFIGLASPELSAARVAQRVERGGHDIPDDKLAARYPRTLINLAAAIELADHLLLFDNSSADRPYRFVAEFEHGALRRKARTLPGWTRNLIE
jgi:predicted ABC-type ATPase